jgi:hypothetical protein
MDNPSQWKDDPNAKSYLRALKQTPARIHASGLGQAMAFLKSRGKDPAKWAAEDIGRLTLELLGHNGSDLLAKLEDEDSTFQFLASEEVLAVVGWLSSYLEGEGVKPGEED